MQPPRNLVLFLWIGCLVCAGELIAQPESTVVEHDALRSADIEDIEALSHYGWGLFLSPTGQLDEEDLSLAAEHLLLAIKSDPMAPEPVDAYLSLWPLPAVEGSRIRTHLLPLATQYPRSIPLNLAVSRMYMDEGAPQSARKVLDQLMAQGGSREVSVIRAYLHFHLSHEAYQDAEQLLSKALKSKDLADSASLRCIAARFFFDRANRKEALDFRTREKLFLKGYQHAMLAARLIDASAREEARELIEVAKILKSGEFHAEVVEILQAVDNWRTGVPRTLISSARVLRAQSLEAENRNAEALAEWQLLAKLEPCADHHLRAGLVALRQDKLHEAIDHFSLARRLAIRRNLVPRICLQLAALYRQVDDPDQTLHYARLAPRDEVRAYLLQAWAYQRKGNPDAGRAAFAAAEKYALDNGKSEFLTIDYYISRATFEYDEGQKDEAIRRLRELNRSEPENDVVCNFLGYALAEQKQDLDEADRLIRIALKHKPESVAYIDSLAWVNYQRQRYEEAAVAIEKALALQDAADHDPVILDHAGDIFERLEAYPQALSYWQQALKRAPKNEKQIREKIETLQNNMTRKID